MTVTLFGVLVIVIGGALLVWGTLPAMLIFVMATSLMSGSAAFVLSALGGSSVPTMAAAMPFLALRCVLPGSRQGMAIKQSIGENLLLAAFAIYGALSAYVLPWVFAGKISVTPLRPIKTDDPFVTFPLSFSPQNVTVSVYLLTTLVASVCTAVVVRQPGAVNKLVRVAAIIAIVHAAIGFLSVIVAGTPAMAILEVFRNGNYAQLEQNVRGFVRMNGIAPEPSGYAALGFTYFVLVAELWWRDIDRRWTGFASFVLFCALAASTSSTAYVGFAGYALIMGVRSLLFPASLSGRKFVALSALLLVGAIGVILVILVLPRISNAILNVASQVLFEKSESLSGMQRLMWAKQGWKAFWLTGGLGIGMGSFRSSSIVTAIMGATGVIGMITFGGHLLRVLRPFHQSTYVPSRDRTERVAAAAGWAACLMLIPAAAAAATPDPGILFGIFGGMALGLRLAPERGGAKTTHASETYLTYGRSLG